MFALLYFIPLETWAVLRLSKPYIDVDPTQLQRGDEVEITSTPGSQFTGRLYAKGTRDEIEMIAKNVKRYFADDPNLSEPSNWATLS